jgi:crossover junction endodeoxyribonuclease RuvC
VRLVELPPADVKKALTGSGRADKGQMQRAVQQAFGLAELPQPADVADALAMAWTAAGRAGQGSPGVVAAGAQGVGEVNLRRRSTRVRRLPPGTGGAR